MVDGIKTNPCIVSMERGNVLDVFDYGYGGYGISRGFEYHWIFIGSNGSWMVVMVLYHCTLAKFQWEV